MSDCAFCADLQVEFMREKYWEFDYEEVVTPNIFNFDLWKTSGHADHYRCATCTFCMMLSWCRT